MIPEKIWTTSTDDIKSDMVTTSLKNTIPTLFQRIIDSFKPPLPSENTSIEMIAIGGAIGTGLFVGAGSALATGGPAALILDFSIIGFMLYNVCMALGELSVVFPVSGSFNSYSSRFLDPAWGFAMGWNYALNWLIVMPLELTAAGLVINYWSTSVNIAVWITVFLIALLI